jgi:hypothetical protein
MRKILERKGYYYSLDALIAVIVIFAILFVIKPVSKQKSAQVNLQEDTIIVLSSLKMKEIDNEYAQKLLAEGNASENLTILEQIAEFHAKGRPEAQELANNILANLTPGENIGIWFNNELVASYNSSSFEEAEQVWTARQMVSGIEKPEEGDIRGYSARAFLTRASQIDYFYFGGYVGDGNISLLIDYNGTLKSASMEIAINKDFDLYVNDNFEGHYEKTTSLFSPQSYDIPTQNFQPGENIIELVGSDLYIAGGYVKVNYNDSTFTYKTKKFFPGIEGRINIYDSFYSPGNITEMRVFLHYSSPYTLFLNIGNTTVYEDTGDKSYTLTNAELDSMLDYEELSKKTIPLRLGLYEIQNISRQGNADVVLITDLSGSMNNRMDSDANGVERDCDDPNLYEQDTQRLSLAKCLDKMVVEMILNVAGNKLALSAFYGDITNPYKGRVYYEDLTNDPAYLKSKIDAYAPQGGTCICCSENNAYNILNEQSNESRQKFVIVMSDGIPTHTCQAASGCEGTRDGTKNKEGLWLGWGAGCYGGLDDCSVNDCECASQNANWSSCRLRNDLGATVYAVGFGPVASCWMANKTLRNIADCGNGDYYSSQDPDKLKEIYEDIASEILSLSYIEQVSNITGEFNETTLYPDSYIYYDYDYENPFGLIITSESDEFGNEISEGNFTIPPNSEAVEVIAVSYSGPRWTDKVRIYNSSGTWEDVFDLASYGSDYLTLGDPYFVNLPIEKIKEGENKVKITTGTSPLNSSGGSVSDKVIFTIIKQALGYSPIKASASGCIWTIEFFDFTNISISVPQNYSDSRYCYYTSDNIAYNENNALDYAVYDLLRSLDFDSDNRIDSKFSEQDLNIDTSEIAGIPYTHYSEVQVRVWR